MEETKTHHVEHPGYGLYVLVWLTLLSLTSLTVGIAGIDLGWATLLVAIVIAAVKSGFVINIFMHIKFDDKMFKAFIILTIVIIIIVFALTSFDIIFR